MKNKILTKIMAVLLSVTTLLQSCSLVSHDLISSLEISIDFEGDLDGEEKEEKESKNKNKEYIHYNLNKIATSSQIIANNFSDLEWFFLNQFKEIPFPPPKAFPKA